MTAIERTFSHVRAAVHRAEQEGARSISLSIQDLKELLPHFEAGIHKAQVEGQMKPAGWVDPGSLRYLRAARGNSIKLHRRKSVTCNTQLYFCVRLGDKVREAEAALAAQKSSDSVPVVEN